VIKKIAAPLYEFQALFYSRLGKSISGQDGELLQFIGEKIERECPGWLAARFLDEVARHADSIVLNDDCRINSYVYLKQAGFVFVKVATRKAIRESRLRRDHSALNRKHITEFGFDRFEQNFVIDNNGSLASAAAQIDFVLGELVG